MNFDICCPIENDIVVAKDLQQIRVDEPEIRRRIACFINRKRDEINSNNIQDFITEASSIHDNDLSCARVNSTVYRIKDSKSHLKIHRVKNETGPQTTNYKNALNKLMENVTSAKLKSDPNFAVKSSSLSSGLQERLENAESFLNLHTEQLSTKPIFQRLKEIENRILYLETLSPEYSHFLVISVFSRHYNNIIANCNNFFFF